MANENTVSIPLVDILSEQLGKRIVMSGNNYVEMDTLNLVATSLVEEAKLLKASKEKKLKVPTYITMRQARLYLHSINLLDGVGPIVEQNKSSQIEWEYGSIVERDNELTTMLQGSFNLTDEQVDNMFIEASKL